MGMPRRLNCAAQLVALALALITTAPGSLSSRRSGALAFSVSGAAGSNVVGTIWASSEARSDNDRDRARRRKKEERKQRPRDTSDDDPNRDLMASKAGSVKSQAYAIAKAILTTGKAKVRACGPEPCYNVLKAIIRAEEMLQRQGVSPTQNLAAFPEFQVVRRSAQDTNFLVYYCRLLEKPATMMEIDRDRSVVVTNSDSTDKMASMASAIKHRLNEIKVAVVLSAGSLKIYKALKILMLAGRFLWADRDHREQDRPVIAVIPSYYEQLTRGVTRIGMKLSCFEVGSLPEPEALPHLLPLNGV
eukprot:TRINITY_DN58041_c0_g1_i1.p1 TRINITY_DN58041_c0_g1~~TRINITY_DN58041_c0_g1_i1.p1  ORF type:complete len:303 (-),score=32.84 TRINITY_DN58041_c0_g1_i1:84-992(-)